MCTERNTARPIAKINELKEAFLSALDTRSLEQLQALEKREDYIEMTMICALVMVGIITVLNMAVTRIQIMRPVLAVKNQIGEISRGKSFGKIFTGVQYFGDWHACGVHP